MTSPKGTLNPGMSSSTSSKCASARTCGIGALPRHLIGWTSRALWTAATRIGDTPDNLRTNAQPRGPSRPSRRAAALQRHGRLDAAWWEEAP